MSKSQDYIARIRYQNDLPPPPLPPNLLNYKISKEEQIGSSSLLSSLYRKENVNNLIKLNDDLGMPIDIINVPEIFDPSKENLKLYSLSENLKLHPNDRILLRDPGIDKITVNQPNVAFLRRTEYIGSSKKQNSSISLSNSKLNNSKSLQEDNTPATQLRSIESTFINSTKSLKNPSILKHPLKKNLKAKKVWSLLPDTSRMDQSFSSIRLLGSASSSNRGTTSNEFNTSIFRPVELEQADWMSFYTTNEESSKIVKRTIDDLNENVPNDNIDENLPRFKYIKKNDYDMKAIAVEGGIKDIALRFDHKKNFVLFNPIASKAELKRHRLHDSLKELVEQVDYDEINLRIREPTTQELNIRNAVRHSHDPVNYEAVEEVQDEDSEIKLTENSEQSQEIESQ